MSDSVDFASLPRVEQLFVTGLQLQARGELEPAKLHYLAVLQIDPDHFIALQNMSALLISQDKFHAAISIARRARKINPRGLHVLSNMANALVRLRHYDEAEGLLIECTRIMTDEPVNAAHAGVWHNYALVKFIMGDYKKAMVGFEKSRTIYPGQVNVEADRSLCLLAQQEIEQGLVGYEARWEQLYKCPVWELGIPEWKGEDVRGKHVLVHHEQGFGDGLMFVRFLKNFNDMGAQVSVACPPDLAMLFEQNFPYVTCYDWKSMNGTEAKFDFHTPMMSMLKWLGVTSLDKISPEPYLKSNGGFQFAPALRADRPKIGLCWSSGDHGANLQERRRDIPLHLFFPLIESSDFTLVSLQKGENEKDLVRYGVENIIHNPMNRVQTFYDSAQIVAELDLVITVDSAVAHLAGAMGKPCIVLGPFTRCWRWWGDTNGLPWYNKMRIYKQSMDGTWNNAVRNVIRAVNRGDFPK